MSFVPSTEARAAGETSEDEGRGSDDKHDGISDSSAVPTPTKVHDNLSSQVSELHIQPQSAAVEVEDIPMVDQDMPGESDSGDEVVLFAGRHQALSAVQQESPIVPQPSIAPKSHVSGQAPIAHRLRIDSEVPISQVTREIQNPSVAMDDSVSTEAISNKTELPVKVPTRPIKTPSKVQNSGKKNGKFHRKAKKGLLTDDEDISEAELADYVANMRESGELDGMVAGLQAFVGGKSLDSLAESGWGPSELEDLDDLSTSEEILGEVEFILSKRERPSGLQYLVSWEGQSMDEARWILHSQLDSVGVRALIADFEEQEQLIVEYDDDDEEDDSEDVDLDDDDDEDEDDEDEEEDFKDELDLLERKMARMTDEKIARMFAKQTELGIISDELMLFDASDGDEDEIAKNRKRDEAMEADFISFSSKPGNSRAKRRQGKQRSSRPDPTEDMLDHDEYGDFDIMDLSRPSLGLGARAGEFMSFGLSDSEAEAELREVWAGDRKKKKAKKLEREELRAAGLLGKKSKTRLDMDTKYAAGIGADQIKTELENFMSSDREASVYIGSSKFRRLLTISTDVRCHQWTSVIGSSCTTLHKSSASSRNHRAKAALDIRCCTRRHAPAVSMKTCLSHCKSA